MFVSEEGSPRVEQMKARDELYKIRSSRKTDSLLANRSSEHQFSGKTYFYTLASSLPETLRVKVTEREEDRSGDHVLENGLSSGVPHNDHRVVMIGVTRRWWV